MDKLRLETARLILRPLKVEDAESIFEYAQNPQVSKFTLWEPHQIVGCFWISKSNQCMELAYALSADHWGKGIVSEACEVLMNYCFKEYGLKQIQAHYKKRKYSKWTSYGEDWNELRRHIKVG